MKEIEIGRKFRAEMIKIAEKLEIPIFAPWKIPDPPLVKLQEGVYKGKNPCDRIMGACGRAWFIEMKRIVRVAPMEPDFARVKILEMFEAGQLESLRSWAASGNKAVVILGQVEQRGETKTQYLKLLYVMEILKDGELMHDLIPWTTPETRKRKLAHIFLRGAE